MDPVRQSILLRPTRFLPYKNATSEEACFQVESARLNALRVQREERHAGILRSLHGEQGADEKQEMRQQELSLIEAKRLAEARERETELNKEHRMNLVLAQEVSHEDKRDQARHEFVRKIALQNKDLIGYRKNLRVAQETKEKEADLDRLGEDFSLRFGTSIY